MPSPSLDLRKQAAILKAAQCLFLHKGFTLTRMEDVAKQAGVTKQTVYAHYTNKNTLFAQVIQQLTAEQGLSRLETSEHKKSFEEELYQLGLTFIQLSTSADALKATRLVIATVEHNKKLSHLYYANGTLQMREKFTALLEGAIAKGGLKIDSPRSAASYFFSLLRGNYYLKVLLDIRPYPSEQEREAHIRECIAIFIRLYGGSKPLQTYNSL